MFELEINDADITFALSRIAAALTDPSPVMNEIGMFLVASTGRRFDETKAPDGSTWAARSETTLAIYDRQKATYGAVLHKSGTLRQSIFHSYGPDEVTVGSNVLYSAVMQFGAAKGSLGKGAPWGNIPARPFLGLSEEDKGGVVDIVGEWLERAAMP